MFLDNINNLTPVFRNAVEDFIPKWLNTIIQHYDLAKEKQVDILELANEICYNGEQFERNGFHYNYYVNGSGMSVLSLDGSNGHYTRIGFRECLIKMYPELDVAPESDMGKFSELFNNSLYFDHYLWRLFNRKAPYDDLRNKVDEYFKRLTRDNNVGFSLSSTSMIYFNPKAQMYIDHHFGFW